MDLIEIKPENAKVILKAAKAYKRAQKERLAALEVEVKEKQKVLELVKAAKLQPLENGNIRFRLDGVTISIQPRDELVKVKEDNEESD